MHVLDELREKYRDLAASNMSTTLGVLKCCGEPGGVCDKKRIARRPWQQKKNLKTKIHCIRPENT